MKIRNGFVSNSSTSSFIVFGILYPVIEDLAEALNIPTEDVQPKSHTEAGCGCSIDRGPAMKFCPNCGKPAWKIVVDNRRDEKDELKEKVESKCRTLGLEVREYDGVYVGGWPGTNQPGKAAINQLTEINDKLLATFGREGRFYGGEYPC